MTFYFLLFLVAFFSLFMAKRLADEATRSGEAMPRGRIFLWFLLAFLAFEIPAALRYGVGTDYLFRYLPDYQTMMASGKEPDMEAFFVLLYRFFYHTHSPFQWFFVITSFLINGFFLGAIALDKNHEYPLSISIFFLNCVYFCSLSNIRQYLALAIGVFVFSWNINRKRSPWQVGGSFLLLLWSTTCHFSGLLYLFLYAFLLFRPRGRFLASITIAFVLLSPLITAMVYRFLENTKYVYFLTNYLQYGRGVAQLVFILPDFFFFFVSIYLIFFTKKGQKNPLVYQSLLFSCFGFISYLITYILKSNELFLRIYHMFYAFPIVLAPHLLRCFREEHKWLVLEGKKDGRLYAAYDLASLPLSFIEAKPQELLFLVWKGEKYVIPFSPSEMSYQYRRTLCTGYKRPAYSFCKYVIYLLMCVTLWMQEFYVPIYGVLPYRSIFG